MRDLPLAASLIKATVKAVNVPVTVKMRMGWDHNSLNAPELAHIAEDLGAKMITVHGRTRCQMYKALPTGPLSNRSRKRFRFRLSSMAISALSMIVSELWKKAALMA